MQIESKFKTYRVIIEKSFGFINELCSKNDTQYVIDSNVFKLYEDLFENVSKERLFLIEAKEENKILDTALNICEKMADIPAKRNVLLVSIGGGIVQDITGFVANILYRGIEWIFVPTTLLAACDSCIGGKTSLNYKKYKNLLGTFYPPSEIHIYSGFFHTLSEKDYKSGLGEVVKFNLMDGDKGYRRIDDKLELLLLRKEEVIAEFILSSLEFKREYIEIDEFDKNERVKLNFAHTFGHAIEVLSDYEIPHGTAVAIGMIIADRIASNRGLLSRDNQERCKDLLLKIIDINIETMKKSTDIIVDAMKKDKKQTSESLTAVLRTDKPRELLIVKDILVSEVEDGFEYFYGEYRWKN